MYKLVYKFYSTNTNYFSENVVVYYTFIEMTEVIIDKKLAMRKIFKKIVESKFQEMEEKISHETNEDLKLEEVKH